jgi:hypothetical protein
MLQFDSSLIEPADLESVYCVVLVEEISRNPWPNVHCTHRKGGNGGEHEQWNFCPPMECGSIVSAPCSDDVGRLIGQLLRISILPNCCGMVNTERISNPDSERIPIQGQFSLCEDQRKKVKEPTPPPQRHNGCLQDLGLKLKHTDQKTDFLPNSIALSPRTVLWWA